MKLYECMETFNIGLHLPMGRFNEASEQLTIVVSSSKWSKQDMGIEKGGGGAQ